MPRTSRRRRRAPPPLPVRGPPPLPSLSPVPATITLFHALPGLVETARALVRAGAANRHDWDRETPTPGRMIQRAVERAVAHANHCTRADVSVCAFVRPWASFMEEVLAECESEEHGWVLGISCEETYRLPVGPLVARLGEAATAVVLDRLMRHVPLCIGGTDELEWIIDGWKEAETGESEDAQEILHRAEEGTVLSLRLDRLMALGTCAPLDVVPPGRIRRLVGLLAALDRIAPAGDDTAWRLTEDAEWSLPHPAIHLIWDHGCPLDHAVDEAEHLNAQDGSSPMPQQMWLLDPRNPDQAATTWRRWLHVLRQCRAVSRLLHALEEHSSPPSPPT